MKIQIQRFGRDIKSLLGWASLKQSVFGQNKIMKDPEPQVSFCVDCLHFNEEEVEAPDFKAPKSNAPLCGDCYERRAEAHNERMWHNQYDWQPLYDDRGI